MKRYSILASLAAIGGAVAFQGSFVDLQSSTPGTAQSGHLNITGTARAGIFKGNGSQLTNLNGSEVRTGVITLTGSSSTYIIRASNNDGSPNASALIGIANSPTGITYGAWAETKSNAGRALFGYASATSGATYGSYAVNNSTGGRAAFGLAQATNGTNYGGWFQSNSPIGVGTYARNTAGGIGLRAESTGKALDVLGGATFSSYGTFGGFVGIGTTNPSWPLHIISGENVLVRAEGTVTSGQAATGYFSTQSTIGSGIYARANSATGTASAVRAYNASPNGLALYGEGHAAITGNVGIGTSSNPPSEKLRVENDNPATNGTIVAINGVGATAVFDSRRAILAQSYGLGQSIGLQTSSESLNSNSYGILAQSWGAQGSYAVFGKVTGGGWAGYFDGELYAKSASSGIKAFMIDHPMDPANKVLTHSSVESDERKNIYDGTVTTDERGLATITMPTWFEALNENFRYQITVIDDANTDQFVLAKVVKRLKYGKFTIRTSVPNTTVSWQITGNRHDPVSNYYPLEIEREKKPFERGKYFTPEAFGKPEELGIGYVPTATQRTSTPKKRG